MTQEELQAIKARAEAASPGPWEILIDSSRDRTGIPTYFAWAETPTVEAADLSTAIDKANIDAEFVTSARADVPALVAEVERLTAERNLLYAQRVADAQTIATMRAQLAAVPVDAIRMYWILSDARPEWDSRNESPAECAAIQLWLDDQDGFE